MNQKYETSHKLGSGSSSRNKIHGISMEDLQKFHGIPWKFHGIPRNFCRFSMGKKSMEIPWKRPWKICVKIHGNSMEKISVEIPWKRPWKICAKIHGNSMEKVSMEIPWKRPWKICVKIHGYSMEKYIYEKTPFTRKQ